MPDEPKQQKLRLKDRRERLMWVKVAAGSSVVAFALLVVWYGAHRPEVTIADISISGDSALAASAVEDVARSALAGSYFALVPRANAFVFPKDTLVAAIAHAFPEVAEISVTRSGWTALSISLTERIPVALWCQSDSCYLMDKDGFVFAKAGNEKTTFIGFSGVLTGEPVGQMYLPGDFASFKSFVEEVSSTVRRSPESVLVEENGDVSLAFQEGGALKFVLSEDREAVLANIVSVFGSPGFGDGKTLDYADFRFGDKVYVKFIEE